MFLGVAAPIAHAQPSPSPGEEELCRAHMALVHMEVRTISARLPGHVHLDDLVSAGMAALVAAARSFDPEFGVPFARFAARRIRGALLDELRSADWATRSLRSRARARDLAPDTLAARLGRVPSAVEIAAEMGIELAELDRMQTDLHHSVVLRIDQLTSEAGADAVLPATSETPESQLVDRERQAYLRDAVHSLPERLRVVVEGCFFEDRPMREMAEELGVTESRISQMRAEALKMLRDGMNSQLDPDMLSAPKGGGVVARRRESYYALIAGRSSYGSRLSAPAAQPPHPPVEHSA
jgi:RNA polymerase sigma factor FliA